MLLGLQHILCRLCLLLQRTAERPVPAIRLGHFFSDLQQTSADIDWTCRLAVKNLAAELQLAIISVAFLVAKLKSRAKFMSQAKTDVTHKFLCSVCSSWQADVTILEPLEGRG